MSRRTQLAKVLAIVLAGAAAAEEPIFREQAAAAGLDFTHFNGMSGRFYFSEVVGAGGALLDFDNDGDLDVYLVQGRMLGPDSDLPKALFPPKDPLPLSDRLFRNDLVVHPNGRRTLRFTDVTAASGIAATGYGMGVATGDFDNDGWTDLYVTNFAAPNQLWRNRGADSAGTVTFADVTAAAGVGEPRWSVPAVFFDFDRDGWLDLYVGNYMDFTLGHNKPCLAESGRRDYCGPQTYEPEPDRLFHNLGRGPDGRVTFADVSEASGITAEYGATLGLAAADFDGDGWLDVYVANDQTANQLWLNRGGAAGTAKAVQFANDALLLGCALNRDGQAEASMGVDAGDFDGDGDEDLFMTHLTRESNTLYVNDGRGLFRDRSLASGLANPSWGYTGFGTAWLDYDNDGWLDLFSANGSVYILFELARRGDPYPLRQPNQLFRNLGPAADGQVRFAEVTARAGPAMQQSEVSRGALFGDLDNDGDTDLVVTNNSGPARLLVNQVGSRAHWLGLRLTGGEPPRDLLGARVAVHRPGKPPLWRRVRTGGSFASANDPRVLIGLGSDTAVERVEVHWPDGRREAWQNLPVDAYSTLAAGSGRPVEAKTP